MNVLLFAPPSPGRPQLMDAVHLAGHELSIADTVAHASSMLARDSFALIVVDLAVGQGRCGARVPVICLADRRQPEVSTEALRLGVVDIVGRPVEQDEVVARLPTRRRWLEPRSGRNRWPSRLKQVRACLARRPPCATCSHSSSASRRAGVPC